MDDHTHLPQHRRNLHTVPNRQMSQQQGIAAARSNSVPYIIPHTQSHIPPYQPSQLHQNSGHQNRLPATNQPIVDRFINNNTKHSEYCTYTSRLATYSDYPPSVCQLPESLAEAGFYYAGNNDSVTCYQCGTKIAKWLRSHDHWERHVNCNDQCDYVKTARGQQFITDIKMKYDLCLSSAEPMMPPRVLQQEPVLEETAFFSLPLYPKYKTNESRLETFIAVSSFIYQTPKDLSEAGLFHTGIGDYTRCFQCGGGIHAWEKGDIPLVEHLRWHSYCPYLHKKLGEEIIKKFEALFKEDDELTKERDELTSHTPSHEPPVPNITDFNSSEAKKWIQRKKDICQNKLQNVREKIKTTFRLSQLAPPLSNETPLQKQEPLPTKEALHAENRKLKEHLDCKICYDDIIAITFLPCGHLATCVKCSKTLKDCPICRTPIKNTVRAILT